MNKLLLSALALLLAAAPADAQLEKINAIGRMELNTLRLMRQGKITVPPAGSMLIRPLDGGQVVEPVVGAVVRMNPGCSVDILNGMPDVTVTAVIDAGFATVSCPLSVIEKIAELPEVKSVSVGGKEQPMLNFARPAGNVTTLQDGTFSHNGTTHTYDGTGVVCGMMDTGLDANHINFKNSDGTSRISHLWHLTSSNGTFTEYTADNISTFTTDNAAGSHATHVAGIIGGGYKGNGTYGLIASAGSTSASVKNNQPMPYYGVATGADLAFSVGSLYHDNVLVGVTKIVEYAESQGKPCVINMSLGSTNGPHDGTDDYTQALNSLASRAVICMSSGNDGGANISASKKITASTGNAAAFKTFVDAGTGSGYLDIWSSNGSTLKASWYLYNTSNKSVTLICQTTLNGQSATSSTSADFKKYFSGSLEMSAAKDVNNGRFQVLSRLSNVKPLSTNTSMGLCLWIEGAPTGTTIYAYGNTDLALSNKPFSTASVVTGYTSGSPSNSINNACCAPNIISVGSFNSSKYWATSTGDVYSFNGGSGVGEISTFSSYGTVFDPDATNFAGRKLPVVCGPGSPIVSSYSRYYNTSASSLCGKATVSGTTYPWGIMQGTSMSCPFVTGTVGLWMQADPTLDAEAVKEIIATQSSTEGNTTGARWGAGKIDGAKAMSYILETRAAIGDITADSAEALVVNNLGSTLDIYLAGADNGYTVSIVDLQGRTVATTHATEASVSLSTSSLSRGIYILAVTTPGGARHTLKLTL